MERRLTGLIRAAAFWLLTLLVAQTAAAQTPERRIALVIGNAAYENAGSLANPRNDAEDMARMLKRVGFEVIEARDLNKRAMETAIARFERLIPDADAALVFYAGHGLQHLGQNYLVPVDAKLEDEFSIRPETIRLDDVVGALARARGVRILILDACRNNPFTERLTRSATTRDYVAAQGLARIERTQGMVVAYATQASQVAVDGTGRNSPFTAALVKELEQPGLEIGTVFRRVAFSVSRATAGKQIPELSISLLGEFYFNRSETDAQAWSSLRASQDRAALDAFVKRFPTSDLADLARARIERLDRDQQDRERLAREQTERERQLKEQLARLEAEREKARAELAAREAADRERLARAQAERDQAAREQAAREQSARDQAAQRERPTATAEAAARDEAERARRKALDAERETAQRAKAVEAELTALAKEAARPTPELPADPERKQLAALGQPPVRTTDLPPPDETLVPQIKQELKRLGCYAGPIDKAWGSPATARALREIARLASLPSPDAPNADFLKSLRERGARVCPLACGPRQVARGEVCVAKTCPRGERLDADGDCVEIPRPARVRPIPAPAPRIERVQRVAPQPAPRRQVERAAAPRPAAPSGGGRRCFSHAGQTFCE